MGAEVGGVEFEEVVADEGAGVGGDGLFSGGFSSESFLEIGEGSGLVVFEIPSDDFSVENTLKIELCNAFHDFRERWSDDFFAAAPKGDGIATLNKLSADSVPFVFNLPFVNRA